MISAYVETHISEETRSAAFGWGALGVQPAVSPLRSRGQSVGDSKRKFPFGFALGRLCGKDKPKSKCNSRSLRDDKKRLTDNKRLMDDKKRLTNNKKLTDDEKG
jgi:hypothetical protein